MGILSPVSRCFEHTNTQNETLLHPHTTPWRLRPRTSWATVNSNAPRTLSRTADWPSRHGSPAMANISSIHPENGSARDVRSSQQFQPLRSASSNLPFPRTHPFRTRPNSWPVQPCQSCPVAKVARAGWASWTPRITGKCVGRTARAAGISAAWHHWSRRSPLGSRFPRRCLLVSSGKKIGTFR